MQVDNIPLSYTTLYQHISAAYEAIIRVSYKNTKIYKQLFKMSLKPPDFT